MLNITKFITKNFEKLSLKGEDTKSNLVGNGFYDSFIVDNENLSHAKRPYEFNQNLNVKNKQSHPKNYFGAFVNTDYMENKDMINLGIPRFVPKGINTINLKIGLIENRTKIVHNELIDYLSEEANKKSKEEKPNIKELNKKVDFNNIWIEISLDDDKKTLKNFNKERHKNFLTIPQIIFKNMFPENFQLSLIKEESLLFNPYKIANFDIALQKSMNNIFYNLDEPISLNELKPQLFYLLQGIPSKIFMFNEFDLSFYITDENMRLIGSLPAVTANFMGYFIEFGNKVLLIQTITHYYIYNSHDTPSVLKVTYN